MPAASASTSDSHVFEVDADQRFEVHASSPTHSHLFVVERDADAWLWCFRCERAFQVAEARNTALGLGCAYPDCGGETLDFWSWEAFCVFVGDTSLTPDYATRYPLAA